MWLFSRDHPISATTEIKKERWSVCFSRNFRVSFFSSWLNSWDEFLNVSWLKQLLKLFTMTQRVGIISAYCKYLVWTSAMDGAAQLPSETGEKRTLSVQFIWPNLGIYFRMRWIMPWKCLFLSSDYKGSLDSQHRCGREHLIEWIVSNTIKAWPQPRCYLAVIYRQSDASWYADAVWNQIATWCCFRVI